MPILSGFRHPVFDSQRVFRAALQAMAYPGQPQPVTNTAGHRLKLPCFDGVHAASVAWLLALADLDTPLWLDERWRSSALPQYLRFHTGTHVTPQRQAAYFALFGEGYRGAYFADFPIGSDAYPDRSATLIMQATDFTSGAPRVVGGPGIGSTATLRVAGIAPHFWKEWQANQALYPCGIDVVFTTGDTFLGLPRSITGKD
jgi:alpha-D-ribose 1-methylphosphonate 5-triphosphate synthase subunit PhnH